MCFPGLYLGPGICSVISGASHVLMVIYLFFTFTFKSYSEELLPHPLFFKALPILDRKVKAFRLLFRIEIYYTVKYVLKSDDHLFGNVSCPQPCYCQLAK